ncbi:3'-5' exonuclease [Cooperia oncophora]
MLQLHKISPDYASNKPKSLAGIIVSTLHKWLLKRDDDTELFDRCVTQELQMEAFRIATAKHTGYLRLFKEIFCLDDVTLLSFIKDEINSMIDRHMFKEAMDVVEEFDLHSDYGLYAFVIPCLLQDKLSAVVKYIEKDRKMQESFVSYLDSFVGLAECEVIDRLKAYKDSQIMTMQYERFTGKTIEKMIYKLTNELALPVETVAPNLFRVRKEGDLRFKAQSRFVNQELNDDAYFGHISETLKEGDESLKMYFINFLTGQRNFEDAVRWVVYCNIPDARLPRRLQEYINSTPGVLYEAELNIRRLEERALDVGDDDTELMPGYPIIMITTWKQLNALMGKLKNETHIGIDSEWRPYVSTSESIALLQIATKDAVYLVDFCSLKMESSTGENAMEQFLRTLLCSPSMKIGFDLTNDLRALFAGSSMSQLRPISDEIRNVVCVKMLVENVSPFFLLFSHYVVHQSQKRSLMVRVSLTVQRSIKLPPYFDEYSFFSYSKRIDSFSIWKVYSTASMKVVWTKIPTMFH